MNRLTKVVEIDARGATFNESVNKKQIENGHGQDDCDDDPHQLQQYCKHHHLQRQPRHQSDSTHVHETDSA